MARTKKEIDENIEDVTVDEVVEEAVNEKTPSEKFCRYKLTGANFTQVYEHQLSLTNRVLTVIEGSDEQREAEIQVSLGILTKL